MTRAAIYARVSKDDRAEEGRNLAGQLTMGREYARRMGYTVAYELPEDERGASGAAYDLPQLTKALELARAGQYDVLIVREMDRLARDIAKQYIIEQQLTKAGVRVEYALYQFPDSAEGRLQKAIFASFAEYEREKITQRMTRGRRQKVKAGHIVTRPPYGYRIGEVDGKRALVIHEPEAVIIRSVFEWYIQGDNGTGERLSTVGIANRLTEMGAPTWSDIHCPSMRKRGRRRRWYDSTVRKIITNEVYKGRWIYGRRNCRTNTINPEEHWLELEVPALVSEETWDAAQEARKSNAYKSNRNTRHNYLMRLRATCGWCGRSLGAYSRKNQRGKAYSYYHCATRAWNSPHGNCALPSFPAGQVDKAVWAGICDLLLDPEAALQGMKERQATEDEAAKPLKDRLAAVRDLLEDHGQQLERLLDLYLTGEIAKDMLVEREKRLRDTIAALKREKADLEAQVEARTISDAQIETWMEFSAKTRAGLMEAQKDFAKRRQVVEALDVRGTLTIEGGEKVIYLTCRAGEERLSIENTTTQGSPALSAPGG